MLPLDVDEFVRRAESLYSKRIGPILEAEHRDEFVAIEPDSGDYFLGDSLSEAMAAARRAHPGRLVHGMRVGHEAAIHFGMHIQ